MKRLLAIALVGVGLAVPGYAQRGGGARGGSVGHSGGFSGGGFAGHGGGFSGSGFAVHRTPSFRGGTPSFRSSAPAFRSGIAPTGRSGFMGGNRTLSAVPAFRGGPVRNGAGYGGRRPGYGYGGDRYRRQYAPNYGFGFPYGASGWFDTNYPGYFDSSLYDSPPFGDGDSSYGYGDSGDSMSSATPPTAADPATGYYPGGYGPPVEQAQAAPDNSFRPAYQRAQPEPAPEDAVSLVFKDGRPTEQIHNYLLTPTTLYVQDGRLREIAVGDLDLAATEKVNREAGVDFRLPDGAR
jgi:hypothetical protein